MTGAAQRLTFGGRIDRSTPISFTFNDVQYLGVAGDTLASALLANDVRLLARSFKYHRPRGIYSAGVEEPTALVQTGRGGRGDVNVPATACEIYEGLTASSQNCWPSVEFDLAAVNSLLSPLLAAGFYYKTFIGLGHSTRTWMFFEKFIRRAAGMGSAVRQPDPDRYEKVNAHCDVLVVGAGRAGLAAAIAAAKNHRRVLLVEQDREVGGSALREVVGEDGLANLRTALQAQDRIQTLTRTTAFGAYDGGVFGLVERVTDHLSNPPEHLPRQRFWVVRARRTVLATGAIEQPIVFAGNDLPGVMLAGAVRAYVNRYAVLPGNRTVVFTNNDSAYAAALDLARVGASVTLLDMRPHVAQPILDELKDAGVEVIAGYAVLKAVGGRRVRQVVIGPVDRQGVVQTRSRSLPCDCLCVSGGWSPAAHLWSQIGGRLSYDRAIRAFKPAGRLPDIECVGTVRGNSPQHGFSDDAPPIWRITDRKRRCAGKAFVDLQHDVTDTDIALAHREGYQSAEHLKRYTTQGMATDQGKTANVNAIGLLAQAREIDPEHAGTTTFRPPYTPIAIGTIAGPTYGPRLRPTRVTAIHERHVAQGAVCTEVGLWLRVSHYPEPGETKLAAAAREAKQVRSAVGIADASTLGKIAVQGPDALKFLQRLYVNDLASLPVGGIRYGVMLRDDGVVFDDGTVARLGAHDYWLTTTTAHAGAVLARMEFLLHTAWPDLKVDVTSVTEQWAVIAVAGPRSRAVLEAVGTTADVSNRGLPHLRCIEAEIDGIPVRLGRVSYSGELAYEVYAPSGYGVPLWDRLLDAGAPWQLVPYGTEAMSTLRIEKGHIAGPEMDGRTTLRDLGLEALCAKGKAFVGATLRKRSALEDPARPRLVGLECAAGQTVAALPAGAILFSSGAAHTGHGEGYVTSATYSPALAKTIALALLNRGPSRHGEELVAVSPIENTRCRVRVVAPQFLDPEGKRLNV